jgi:general secretion pathway protein D
VILSRRPFAALLALALGLAPLAAPAQEPPAPPPPVVGEEEPKLSDPVLLKVPPGGQEVAVDEILRDAGERMHLVITIADDSLKGKKIRFYTSAEITFNLLREVLRAYEIELRFDKVDGRWMLHAFSQRNSAQKAPGVPSPFFRETDKLPESEMVVTAVYTVKYADPNGIQNAIRALQTRDPRRAGNIVYVNKSDVLIITDFVSAVDFYLKIARALDQPTPQFTYKMVEVKYADAVELAQLINQLQRTLETGAAAAPVPGQPGQPGQPPGIRPAPGAAGAGPGIAQVVADPRTNKLVILALPSDIEAIERLIREMDVKVEPPPRHFHIYRCQNANAPELADKLNQLLGVSAVGTQAAQRRTTPSTRTSRTSTYGGTTGSRYGTRPAGSFDRTGAAFGAPQPTIQPAPAAAIGAGGAPRPGAQLNPGEAQIETKIVADDQTNSLLIQASPEDFNDIREILKELDKKRLRVTIEAQVWEIAVSDDTFFALEAAYTDDASTNRDPNPTRGHALANFGLTAPVPSSDFTSLQLIPNIGQIAGVPAGPLASGGLIFALTKGGFDKIPLILQALKTSSNANLLTTPFCTTNDGQLAEFLIEQNAPFQVATSTSVSAFQGFDFATATSRLSITPRISSSNNLTLEIQLDIQSFTEPPRGDRPPPSQARSYTGTVTVPNREYVVFGGLEQESVIEGRKTLPILGDIPFLGYLFGSTTYTKERRRIYVFVRPTIYADEDFETEKKASRFLHDNIRAGSLLGPDKTSPIIPEDVLDAEAPGIKSAIYRLFGDGGQLGMPESEETKTMRRAMAEQGKK